MTGRNGFTLLEVLVALAVFGLLLAGLTQGVQYRLRAWQSQAAIGGRIGDQDAVDRALRRMIEVMDPGDGTDAAPVSAGPGRLEFITTLPNGVGIDPPRRIEAALLVDPAHRLVLRWRPYLHARRLRPSPPPVETVLLEGVSQLDLSFWRQAGGWIGSWRSPDLPALVRVRLVFPAGDRRHWPDIVVAPALGPP